MPDFDYKITNKNATYGWGSVCRLAVLVPLAGQQHGGQLPDVYSRVYRIWRSRAAALYHAGWNAVKSPMALQFLRNCPPVGVCSETILKSGMRPCHFQRICPMCFGRYGVGVICRAAQAACFDGKKPRLPDYNLVGVRRAWFVSTGRDLADVLASVARVRKHDVADPVVRGVCAMATVSPAGSGRWRCEVNSLVITRPGRDFNPVDVKNAKTVVRRDKVAAVGGLYKLVAGTFTYPKGLLFGDPAETVKLLNNSPHFRQLMRTGEFRVKIERDDDED